MPWPAEAAASDCAPTESKTSADGVRHTLRLRRAGDSCGAVFWMGSEGRTKAFSNPSTRGVVVRTSSLGPGSEPASALLARKLIRFSTRPERDAWVEFDFGKTRIQPTAYMLRHYASWDTEALRSWRLEGSNDGKNWVVLRAHDNDATLKKKGARGVWKVNGSDAKKAYSKFRIIMTGPNSNKHFYLALSEFEVYGRLFQPRAAAAPSGNSRAVKLAHASDFDENGAVHYLGSEGGNRPFRNPVTASRMSVRASSTDKSSEPAHALLGRRSIRFTTKPVKDSWVEFDFKDQRISLSAYTLKHYNSWDTEALRNWVLEGSNDRKQWDVLRSHDNDTSLSKKGASKTWSVKRNRGPYRYVRVRMTGPNSNKHYYLALSGAEFYGTLTGPSVSTPASTPSPSFTHVSDFDRNGIMFHLGADLGQSIFKNPVDRGTVAVTSSPLGSNSEPASALLDRRSLRFTTRPTKNASVVFDFKSRRVKVRAYTLKHYTSWDTEALRDWVLEGSNDKNNWTVLREHVGDTALNGKGSTHTWSVSASGSFRYLRVRMTGLNSNKHWYLALSGFEVYGDLE